MEEVGVYLSSGYGGAGGGGWYGGSGTVPDSSGDDDRGGGGGSGFVWTSSTAANVPSGYTPTSKYYLTNANTYAGNTSFPSTSGGTEKGHTGNGYARITLISGTVQTSEEVTKEAKRWQNITKQQQNGILTGTFDYNGNEIVETDSEGKRITHSDGVSYIEYIESTGTQYIDTGIQPDSNTDFELNIALNDVGSNIYAIMGARTGIGGTLYNAFWIEKAVRWDYKSTTKAMSSVKYTVGSNLNISKKGVSTTIKTNETTQTVTDSSDTFSIPYNIYIFTINTAGTEDNRKISMKLYDFKIEKNGIIVRDFLPALDDNNVPCLYDKVSKQYFYNAGTGTFVY